MTSTIQIGALTASTFLLVLVIELVRRRALTEEYSFIWIICATCLLGLSIWRGFLDRAAQWLGVYYPPAVLLLVLIFFVFLACLYFSVVISRQREQIEQLFENVAILEATQRHLTKELESRTFDRDGTPT
jgi:hypothetical protein